MDIIITTQLEKKEVISVDMPYYYKHDLLLDYGDDVIYGKIEPDFHTSIKISKDFNEKETGFELKTEIKTPEQLSCYFKEEYKSTAAEFNEAKNKTTEALKDI